MRTMTTSAGSSKLAALALLLVAAFALAALGVYAVAHTVQVPTQPAGALRYSVDPDVRNRRLLELNEGIKPVVTAVPVDRKKRLMELNEGYLPAPFRSPRDRRLYEMNR